MDAERYTAERATAAGRADHAYAILKDRLLAGAHPLGRRLAEEPLAQALGVSRTPVREALGRLHTEGLVVRHPQGGYAPAAPDLHTIRELYEVRFALELDALARPGRLGTVHDGAALDALSEEWESLATDLDLDTAHPEFTLLDEDFHLRLAASAGNRALVATLARVNERIRVVRMQDFVGADRTAPTVTQHREIVGLVRAGRLDDARRRLEEHFAESYGVVEQRAAAAITRMVMADPEASA